MAVSLVCLIFCARHSRLLFATWVVPFLGLTFATVYCRYHYAVDTLAGIPWGLFFLAVGLYGFNRLVRGHAPPEVSARS